jgi:hypothetical protein
MYILRWDISVVDILAGILSLVKGKSDLFESLIQIPEDVFDVFETDAQADEIGGNAGAYLLFFRLGWAWVVEAGWMARLLASPTLARWLKSLQAFYELLTGSCPALMPKPRIAPRCH